MTERAPCSVCGNRICTCLVDTLAGQMRIAGLPEPAREVRFHRTRQWRFDFAWPFVLVAAEVEGGTWVQGAHGRGAHYESDAIKYSEAAIAGWVVIRVTTNMVRDGRALGLIERALIQRGVQLGTPPVYTKRYREG